MHDAGAVGGGEGVEEVVSQQVHLVRGQRPERADPVRQGAPAEIGHDQHEVVPVVDDVEQAHDPRMVHRGQGRGLPPHPQAPPGACPGRCRAGPAA